MIKTKDSFSAGRLKFKAYPRMSQDLKICGGGESYNIGIKSKNTSEFEIQNLPN